MRNEATELEKLSFPAQGLGRRPSMRNEATELEKLSFPAQGHGRRSRGGVFAVAWACAAVGRIAS
jgi:hypothetical protein